jgi:beta-lactamase superfamily II metal-dependent hydrolase
MAKMTFQFLDVGMGDGTLVIMGGDSDASKQLALVDFGVQPFTKFKIGADDALKYLVSEIDRISKARKKTMPYLDHLFITHPDQDHYNRMITLIKALYPSFGFQDLSIGALTYGGAKSRYGKLIKNISPFVVDKSSIANLPDMAHSEVDGMDGSVEPNWTFANGAINVYLLSANYPTTASYVPNPLSLCLMFADQNNNKVILIGDAEREVEAQIIKNFKHATAGFLNAYALKLGHHGSLNGTSEVWVKAVKPNAVFASGDFVWAHPYCKTLEEVANAKTLKEMGEHWFCCGKSGKEYFNNKTKLQICLNLWYVVKNPAGEKMKDSDGKIEHVKAGTTFGVQWELEFNGAAAPTFAHTDTSNPV